MWLWNYRWWGRWTLCIYCVCFMWVCVLRKWGYAQWWASRAFPLPLHALQWHHQVPMPQKHVVIGRDQTNQHQHGAIRPDKMTCRFRVHREQGAGNKEVLIEGEVPNCSWLHFRHNLIGLCWSILNQFFFGLERKLMQWSVCHSNVNV